MQRLEDSKIKEMRKCSDFEMFCQGRRPLGKSYGVALQFEDVLLVLIFLF